MAQKHQKPALRSIACCAIGDNDQNKRKTAANAPTIKRHQLTPQMKAIDGVITTAAREKPMTRNHHGASDSKSIRRPGKVSISPNAPMIIRCIRRRVLMLRHRVGANGCPLTAPLRTVRESFPSHGSGLAKNSINSMHPAVHRNPLGQLGNTRTWPFALRSSGRQLRDAPSDWRRSSFAFPGLRRFHMRSCHSRPDRRGRIRCVTHRLWLLRSSPCCSCYPALRLGRPRKAWPGVAAFPCSAFDTGWI